MCSCCGPWQAQSESCSLGPFPRCRHRSRFLALTCQGEEEERGRGRVCRQSPPELDRIRLERAQETKDAAAGYPLAMALHSPFTGGQQLNASAAWNNSPCLRTIPRALPSSPRPAARVLPIERLFCRRVLLWSAAGLLDPAKPPTRHLTSPAARRCARPARAWARRSAGPVPE